MLAKVFAMAGLLLASLSAPSNASNPVDLSDPVHATRVVRAVSAAAAVPATAAAAAAGEIRAISWNICGEAGGSRGSDGFCPYRNEPQVKVDEIAEVVAEHGANVVLLQEACGGEALSHTDLLQAKLGPEWEIRRTDGARPDGRTDCRGVLTGQLGLAIAVKATVTTVSVGQTLPPDTTGVSRQTLPTLCVTTSAWPTKICTTHVLSDPLDPRRPQQIKNIRDFVWPNRANLLLGGDFNIFPGDSQLTPIADVFDECDRRAYSKGDEVNEFTHHAWTNGTHVYRKRDHIFATKASTGSVFTFCDSDRARMDVTENNPDSGSPSGISDHAPVIAHLRSVPDLPPRPVRTARAATSLVGSPICPTICPICSARNGPGASEVARRVRNRPIGAVCGKQVAAQGWDTEHFGRWENQLSPRVT